MIGVSARPMLPAFGPVPTAVDMPVGVLRGKHDYKKKIKKKNALLEPPPNLTSRRHLPCMVDRLRCLHPARNQHCPFVTDGSSIW